MPDRILFISRHYRQYKMKCPNQMCGDATSITIRRSSLGIRYLKKKAFCTYCRTRYTLVEFDIKEPSLVIEALHVRASFNFKMYVPKNGPRAVL